MTNTHHLSTVKHYYSNAKPTKDILNTVLTIVEDRLKLQPKKVIYADSLCCDDVNSMQFPQNEMIGPFKMGGLGGYPFAGITGMTAFSHHIPEGGAALLIYGPHVGITKKEKIGKILRFGQDKHSSCCGAVTAALKQLLSNQIQRGETNSWDYQQNVIRQILLKEEERIKKSDNQFMEAIDVIYEAIDQRMNALISKTEFPCKYLIQIGGILINGDNGMGSFWAGKRFEFLDLKTGERTSLREKL